MKTAYRDASLVALLLIAVLAGCASGEPLITEEGRDDCRRGESLVCRGKTASKIEGSKLSGSEFCTCEPSDWPTHL